MESAESGQPGAWNIARLTPRRSVFFNEEFSVECVMSFYVFSILLEAGKGFHKLSGSKSFIFTALLLLQFKTAKPNLDD